MGRSRPTESFRLIAGPYVAPRCRVGHTLTCFRRDRDVEVAGFTDTPISWPFAKTRGRRSLILCGDLVRAVCLEAEVAIAHHWGVAVSTVYGWRKALGVSRWTKGSARLSDHYLALGRPASRTLEARAKQGRARAGKPLHPNFRAAALVASRRPKSEAWKRAMSLAMKRQWVEGRRRRSSSAASAGVPPRRDSVPGRRGAATPGA
jgi:hypothetical protein